MWRSSQADLLIQHAVEVCRALANQIGLAGLVVVEHLNFEGAHVVACRVERVKGE